MADFYVAVTNVLIKIVCLNLSTDMDPQSKIWPQVYEAFFMLNSTEHKISTAH